MMRKIILLATFILIFCSCGREQGDVLSLGSGDLADTESYIILNGQDGNHRGFAFYNIEGAFVRGGNFRLEVATPRGISPYTSTSVLMSMDTTNSIYEVDLDGSKTLFHGSNQFSGNIYGIVNAPNGNTYAVESNYIEVFDSNGIRIGSSRINTTVGACTLSNPRGATLNSNGELVVVNQGGGDRVLTYDISAPSATCLSSVALGNNPYDVIQHSDGSLYITTQNDDRVYRTDLDGSNPQVIWETDTSIINNPTGLVEMPNGDLLVASSATDSVERITTQGVRVGTTAFIRDTHSLNIGDIQIIGGDQ